MVIRFPSLIGLLAAGLLAVTLQGCYSVTVTASGYERRGVWLPHHGPGSSHKDAPRITVGGRDMVFDDDLRVYRLVDHPGYYYVGVRYYRQAEGVWEAAPAFDGPWVPIGRTEVPPGLASIE